MTRQRSSRPAGNEPRGNAEVVSIPLRGDGPRSPVAMQIAAAREQLGMTHAQFADYLSPRVERKIRPEHVENWENGNPAPGRVLWECLLITGGVPVSAGLPLLDHVPGAFPASILTGPWVTAYEFTSAGKPHFHADIAHVTAISEHMVHVINHPPRPRTQGRSSPFLNEIVAYLLGRHLGGTWRNTSDTRYFGFVELSVQPGETVMDGHYMGVASDVAVSHQDWRWVKLADNDVSGLTLRDPAEIYQLIMNHTQDDPPLTAADIREDS